MNCYTDIRIRRWILLFLFQILVVQAQELLLHLEPTLENAVVQVAYGSFSQQERLSLEELSARIYTTSVQTVEFGNTATPLVLDLPDWAKSFRLHSPGVVKLDDEARNILHWIFGISLGIHRPFMTATSSPFVFSEGDLRKEEPTRVRVELGSMKIVPTAVGGERTEDFYICLLYKMYKDFDIREVGDQPGFFPVWIQSGKAGEAVIVKVAYGTYKVAVIGKNVQPFFSEELRVDTNQADSEVVCPIVPGVCVSFHMAANLVINRDESRLQKAGGELVDLQHCFGKQTEGRYYLMGLPPGSYTLNLLANDLNVLAHSADRVWATGFLANIPVAMPPDAYKKAVFPPIKFTAEGRHIDLGELTLLME